MAALCCEVRRQPFSVSHATKTSVLAIDRPKWANGRVVGGFGVYCYFGSCQHGEVGHHSNDIPPQLKAFHVEISTPHYMVWRHLVIVRTAKKYNNKSSTN